MTVVFLNLPEQQEDDPLWKEIEAVTRVRRYHSTTLGELLERGRDADVLVSTTLPLRREVLDYLPRVKHVIVPAHAAGRLVERDIAEQLQVEVHALPNRDGEFPALEDVLDVLRGIAGPGG